MLAPGMNSVLMFSGDVSEKRGGGDDDGGELVGWVDDVDVGTASTEIDIGM